MMHLICKSLCFGISMQCTQRIREHRTFSAYAHAFFEQVEQVGNLPVSAEILQIVYYNTYALLLNVSP